jgi:hypothetical protein
MKYQINVLYEKTDKKMTPDIINKQYNWLEKLSVHFDIKYAEIEEIIINLDKLEKILEQCYSEISSFLKININQRFQIFLSPNKEFCNSINIFENNIAIPHLKMANFLLNRSLHSMKKTARHELTHLLIYFWDYKIYHIEMLEEGIACYLSDKSVNYHERYAKKLNNLIEKGILKKLIEKEFYWDASLYVSRYYRTTDYDKAASFVKFLIESYGIEKYKQLYLKSCIDREGKIFKLNGKVLPKTYLYTILKNCFNKNPFLIQIQWLKEVQKYLK